MHYSAHSAIVKCVLEQIHKPTGLFLTIKIVETLSSNTSTTNLYAYMFMQNSENSVQQFLLHQVQPTHTYTMRVLEKQKKCIHTENIETKIKEVITEKFRNHIRLPVASTIPK